MSTVQATANAKAPARSRSRNFFVVLFKRLFKEKPLGIIGLVIVGIMFLTGIFAPLLAPEKNVKDGSPGYNIIHLADRFTEPFSSRYLLGTDQLGRDIFSRIIYGARLTMFVAVLSSILNTGIATAIGMACAYLGGKFDLIVQRFVDAWICFPGLVVLITAMSIVGPGLLQIILVLGVANGLGGSRFARSLVFAIRENQYVQASQAIGARSGFVMMRHILPNIMPMVIVLFTMGLGGMILAEASLSFLGLGLPPPFPSWGSMIAGEGRSNMLLAPWMMFWPGLVLTLVVFGINMFGDALRDLLDPRLRGGLGSYRLDKGEKLAQKIRSRLDAA